MEGGGGEDGNYIAKYNIGQQFGSSFIQKHEKGCPNALTGCVDHFSKVWCIHNTNPNKLVSSTSMHVVMKMQKHECDHLI